MYSRGIEGVLKSTGRIPASAQQWEIDEELSALILELIALSSMDESEPEIKKLKEWTTEMIMESFRRKEIAKGDLDRSLEEAKQRLTRRTAKARLIMEQEAVAGKLKDATETLLSGLKELCDDRTASRRKAFDDIVAETPGRKRKRLDEHEIEEKFKAFEELRRQWKAASVIGSDSTQENKIPHAKDVQTKTQASCSSGESSQKRHDGELMSFPELPGDAGTSESSIGG